MLDGAVRSTRLAEHKTESRGLTRSLRRLPGTVLAYGWLILISIFAAGPFIWILSTSFKTRSEVFTKVPVLIPQEPTLASYQYVLTKTPALRYFLNSLIVAGGTTILAILLTTLGAYALSRFRFRFRKTIGVWLISGQMIPGIITLVPLFVVMTQFRMINSYLGLILADTIGVLPFCVWMLKGYFDTVPVELEEAAMIDGCSRVGAIRRVFLPIASPGIAAVALFAFTSAWQEFMFALTMMKEQTMYPLSVAINFFVGPAGTVEWGNIMAMAVLIIVPSLIFFLFMQRYIVAGLTAGAVKA
jgi:ABC-type glycerol-3-phosphate transport system permease component